jgi:hypothetical protein
MQPSHAFIRTARASACDTVVTTSTRSAGTHAVPATTEQVGVAPVTGRAPHTHPEGGRAYRWRSLAIPDR